MTGFNYKHTLPICRVQITKVVMVKMHVCWLSNGPVYSLHPELFRCLPQCTCSAVLFFPCPFHASAQANAGEYSMIGGSVSTQDENHASSSNHFCIPGQGFIWPEFRWYYPALKAIMLGGKEGAQADVSWFHHESKGPCWESTFVCSSVWESLMILLRSYLSTTHPTLVARECGSMGNRNSVASINLPINY